jgi:hypothetical protein
MLNHRQLPHGAAVTANGKRGWLVGETTMGVPLVQFKDNRTDKGPEYVIKPVNPCFLCRPWNVSERSRI